MLICVLASECVSNYELIPKAQLQLIQDSDGGTQEVLKHVGECVTTVFTFQCM